MTRRTPFLAVVLVLAACGGDAPPANAPASGAGSGGSSAGPAAATLSAIEMEQGIGPIRDLELAALDHELTEEGQKAFTTKCSACHKIDQRYVGPELGAVLSRRRPEFVMNMILNANEMVQKHPTVKELLAQYYTPMPVQVTDPAEARAILEYLRSVQTGDPSAANGGGGQ